MQVKLKDTKVSGVLRVFESLSLLRLKQTDVFQLQ